MSLAGFTLALVLSGTPIAPVAEIPQQIVATEQVGGSAIAQPDAPPSAALPPCPQGAALPSTPIAPGE